MFTNNNNKSEYEDLSYAGSNSFKVSSKRQKQILYFLLVAICGFTLGCLLGVLIKRNDCKNGEDLTNYEQLSRDLQKEVNNTFLLNQMKLISSEIHRMGSRKNVEIAEMMQNNWIQWGMKKVEIFNYTVNQTAPNKADPSFISVFDGDANIYSMKTVEMNGQLPIYHSYSRSGVVSNASVVFANYGLDSDLEELDRLSVKFCGKGIVVLVRLGFSFRSAKVKNIVGKCGRGNLPEAMLTYPDPWDFSIDFTNSSSTPSNTPVYPKSWWLPGDAAVFGNMKMSGGLQPGPLIPDLPGSISVVPFDEMLTPMPVQPINYDDARFILNRMNITAVSNTNFTSSLASYLETPSNIRLQLSIKNIVVQSNVTNLIGQLPSVGGGSSGMYDDDTVVILGNHRDAWAFGTSDPGSGTVILQQVASILSRAYHSGKYRPRRTLLLGSWDGEEEGLLGSSEFTSQFAGSISDHAVAYVNMDCPIKGAFSFNGRTTPLLESAFVNSTRNVKINATSTLFDDWAHKKPDKHRFNYPRVAQLGGGSDHNLFAYGLGVPSSYPEYRSQHILASSPPSYHTRLDNIDYMLQFIDPSGDLHGLVSKFVLDYIIRLTCAPLLPYACIDLADAMQHNAPAFLQSLNHHGFSQYSSYLARQIESFHQSCDRFHRYVTHNYSAIIANPDKLRHINSLLRQLPRTFVTWEGLPLRNTYHNILLSTKLTNSYAASFFTGVADALQLYHQYKVPVSTVYRQISLLNNSLRKAIDLLSQNSIFQ